MKSEGQINIPSVTIAPKDLKVLIDLILKKIDKKDRSRLKSRLVFQGKTFKEEYEVSNLPDFSEFHDGLIVIEISISVENSFEASVVMSTMEFNPLFPVLSNVLIKGQDSTIVSGTLDEIRRFFKKRRNPNIIFHSYGIFVAIALAYIITFVIYADLRAIGVLPEIEKTTLFLIWWILSFPLKSFLRWTFPYILLKGDNRLRDSIRYFLGAIIIGILSNLGYGLVVLNWSLFIK